MNDTLSALAALEKLSYTFFERRSLDNSVVIDEFYFQDLLKKIKKELTWEKFLQMQLDLL